MASFELMFEQQYHGKNVTVSEGGKMAEKIKRCVWPVANVWLYQ